MQSKIQLHAMTMGGDINTQAVLIEECDSDSPHPRLSFARPFLQHIIADNYPTLHVGDQYKENTLNFTFQILHVHISMPDQHSSAKKVVVTGLLLD